MKSIHELCKPRENIFVEANREDALNLADLIQNKINPEKFFSENFITGGMERLLNTAFERFEAKSSVSIIKLTQAMGGGKTHNMIALGLLAKYPELRKKLKAERLDIQFKEPVRVVAFSGRESDAPYGIWGSIAEQLGKLELFEKYYRPLLQAPGETAWINLLQGVPVLILLDELPPYFTSTASTPVGNSDLSVVTTTALSNLLVAVNKAELSNVLIIVSDLRASYESGSQKLNEALQNFDKETNRTALNLEPVQLNSNEVYQILRKKIFETLPDESKIKEVALGFADEIRKAKKMDLLLNSPEEYASQIQESYPFHPAIKDLYARFKENNGFNQTRGLIRLLRAVVANIYNPQRKLENVFLIAPNHFDLNDSAIYNLIANINGSLVNAISHDIAAQSNSIAESLDKGKNGTIYQDVAKAIFIASLAETPNAVKGLTEAEILLYLCAPGVEINFITQTVLSALKTNCWYLHIDKEGKYLFKNTQNIVAKINSIVKTYNRESSLKEVRNLLKNTFHYHQGDVYQDLQILQPIDLIQIIPDKVTLVVHEPNSGGGIHPKIQEFYNNLTFKNRILFLSGERSGMESLLHQAANVKAVQHVLSEMQADKVLTNDPQFIEANDLEVKFKHYFNSAARETFTKLFYPTKSLLMEADFSMNFHSNDYRGEDQIRETLEGKQKFTRATEEDLFRQKCEARLFAAQVMEWSEVKKRAAMQPEWQWHNPQALDKLKERMLRQDGWRENGKYIDKGPFPPPETSVTVSEISREEKTGKATLRLVPSNGDTIYYDFHSPPTTASLKVNEHSRFETSELTVQFLCVDSTGQHPTGKVFPWTNRLEVKYRIFQNNGTMMVELQSIPNGEIIYTTDGSNPKEVGGIYESPFPVKQKCLLQAVSRKDGIESEILKFEVDPVETKLGVKIDPIKELLWKKSFRWDNTNEVYAKLTQCQKNSISLLGARIYITPEPEDGQVWSELSFGDKVKLSAENITQLIDTIRPFINNEGSTIHLDIAGLRFTTGHSFMEWLKEDKLEFEPGDIKQ